MRRILLPVFFLCAVYLPAHAWPILYAEQYYKLYHQHFYATVESTDENIFYLQQALNADFANPLNALTRIENEREWACYRALFRMKCHQLILEEYRKQASKFDKREAYFYNQPYRHIILRSLEMALLNYERALACWPKVKEYADETGKPEYRWIHFDTLYKWQEDAHRMRTGDLDYGEIISKDIARLKSVRQKLEEMDENTYSAIVFP